MAALELQNISKDFSRRIAAVRDLNLSIADGELIVLVGPSGCGKTTTLRMIAGLETPTRGTIRIGERIANDLPPGERRIAMVFQDYALYPHMTVRGNLAFNLKMRKTPRAEIDQRVKETSALVGIADLLDRKPGQLSGGQNQRVALARAIIQRPDVLLLDEPLSNLDAQLRARMRGEIKSLQRRVKTTTIHVTHDQEEAMAMADQLVVMANGAVQQIGTPMDVYRKPANRFVAGFLGNPRMNFIDGRIERVSDGLFFVAARGIRIDLANANDASLQSRLEQPIVLGIRPEHLHPVMGASQSDAIALTATVQFKESLGYRCDIHAEIEDGTLIIARGDCGESLEIDQPIRFQLDRSAIHLFVPGEFGNSIG